MHDGDRGPETGVEIEAQQILENDVPAIPTGKEARTAARAQFLSLCWCFFFDGMD